MRLFNSNVQCSLCNTSLTLWNVHTCTRCGRKLCDRHSYLMKRSRGYVLYSICACCFDREMPLSQAENPSQQLGQATKALSANHT